jgi:flagellum-specific peptidoglycan hydrolase FlgJ
MAIFVPVEEDQGGAAGLGDGRGGAAGDGGDALTALRAALSGIGADGTVPTASSDGHAVTSDMAARGPASTGLGDHADALLHGDDGLLALREQAARAALPGVEQGLGTAYREALAGIGDDRLRAQAEPALRRRLEAALAAARAHTLLQDAVAQAVADRAPPARSRAAALANTQDPELFDHHLATGTEALRRQGAMAGKAPATIAQEASDYRSGIVRDHLDALGMRDPVHAAADLARLRDAISPAARAQVEAGLAPSMADHRAIADVDAAARAGATTAPPTPRLDPRVLLGKMQVIAPTADAAALPDLVQRYGGDAAQAWAAAQLGTKAVDGLIARQGEGWYAALPEDTRNLVEHHMALLGAPGSTRDAPDDVAGAAARIAGQDWPDDRKAAATRELLYRNHRAGQRRRDAESAASDQALAMAAQLGTDFTSLAQIDPATRRLLPAEAVAALTRQADANVHPVMGVGAQQMQAAGAYMPNQSGDYSSPRDYDLVVPATNDTIAAGTAVPGGSAPRVANAGQNGGGSADPQPSQMKVFKLTPPIPAPRLDKRPLTAKDKAFLEKNYTAALVVARKYHLDVNMLLGLSALESRWSTSPQARNNNNTIGATPDGKTPVFYPSIAAAWEKWGEQWGPRIAGVGDDADLFTTRLQTDNRRAVGAVDRRGKYNSATPEAWKKQVMDTIDSVRRRMAKWDGASR